MDESMDWKIFSLRSTLVTLLGLLFFLGANGQEISVTSFKALPNDMTARTTAPVKDANGQLSALIKVVSVEAGFVFEGGSLGIVKAEQKEGEWWVYVPQGARTLTIRHPSLGVLRNYAYPVSIISGAVYEMKLVHGVLETTIIEHQILTEYVIITSEPPGAEVYLNNEAIGKTPFTADKPEGRYEWRVERHLYQTQAGVFELASGTKVRLDLVLKPDFGTLQISSIPEGGAEILLDGLKLGKTTPSTILEVPKGEHTITLMHEWYESISQKVMVEPGKTQSITLTMKPTFAELTVNAMADEELFINNASKGKGKFIGRLAPGVYQVELRKPSHKAASKQITLQPGYVETIVLQPTPIFGSIKVESTPIDAEVYLNGKAYGSTPNIIRELLIGNYQLELRLGGYETIEKKITVGEGSMLEVNDTLSLAVEKNILPPLIQKIEDDMVFVAGGSIMMGCTAEQGTDCWDDEKPAHQVTLSDYYISKYEVTQAQWKEVMGSNPSYFKDCDNCPVEYVNWSDAHFFIRELNKITGKNYRLPTEAEWEFAARGGTNSKRYKYSGSSNINEVGWYKENCDKRTHQVGQKKANELGIYDMTGNVWEWCLDWYGDYNSTLLTNPKGPTSGSYRVCRGGSWFSSSERCKVSSRSNSKPSIKAEYLGFRLVLPLPTYGSLKVETIPIGAEVLLNGKSYGNAPLVISNLSVGVYKMELKLYGYENIKKSIDIFQDSILEIRETLNELVIYRIQEDMVLVEGGTFTMGCTKEQGRECSDNEKPAHQVSLNSFYISKYEVTQSQWREVMGSNPSYFKNCDSCPVENVSWYDVQEFISKLNKMTGKNYRLPTEAEWEYAARGGLKSSGYKFSGSNDSKEVAWHEGYSFHKTHPVGQKLPNELGLYDMTGNVQEWCYDWYGSYSKTSQLNPIGPKSGFTRVYRGGSWANTKEYCRISCRSYLGPVYKGKMLGFRLVLAE